jgi:TFIIH basal transcription factor complex TTD-A subunit
MVNVTKGVLIVCDPAMKQLLLHLDEKLVLGTRFVVQDLDETHVFVAPEMVERLKDQIDELMDKLAVPVVEGVQEQQRK